MEHDSQLLISQNEEGDIQIDVRLEDETVWLTQDQMATLFGKAKSTINEHIQNIFKEGELDESTVLLKFGISEFQQKTPNYYKALAKSAKEYEKFKIEQCAIEKENSLKELEQDLKKLKKNN